MITFPHRETQATEISTSEARKHRFPGYLWELRLLANWTALLPLLVMIGIFLFTWISYTQEVASLAALSREGLMSHRRLNAPILDYATPLRSTLEVLLPLLGVLQVHDILLREWRRGTLPMLASRRSLRWFYVIRLSYVLGYLCLLTSLAILCSWWLSPQPTAQAGLAVPISMGDWFWQSLLTILAPTLLLMALSLLVSHLAVNTLAGIMIPATLCLANWLYALQLQQGQGKSLLISYLLFGWSEQNLSPQPAAWLVGKIVLGTIALLVFLAQVWILQRITLQQKTAE